MTINVIDIDDNCPEFNPKEYNVTIRENLPSNHIIVRVTATDKDSGDNKGLDYGIRSGNEAGTLVIAFWTALPRYNSHSTTLTFDVNLFFRSRNH